MEEDKTTQRSEEICDIIERMPTRWTMWVALIVSLLMGVLFLLGYIIEYPDTVNGQISITSNKAPIRLVSGSTGRIHLLKQNHIKLRKGDMIAYIENGAEIKDIHQLETLLAQKIAPETRLYLPEGLRLGDLGSTYSTFRLSYQLYNQRRMSELYATMRRTLHKQIEADQHVVENIKHELRLKNEILKNLRSSLEKDSLLLMQGGISLNDYKNQYNSYLSYEETHVNLESSHLTKLSDINKNRLDLVRTDIEESEALQQAYANLLAKQNELVNAFELWKVRYLLEAPSEGFLEYLDFWRENTFVQSAQELFTIIPDKNNVIGEVYITSIGSGKVKIGQDANIKLYDFPHDEYGLIKGKVSNISRLTNKITTKEGTVETYQVVVSFPNGLQTNFGKELTLNFETKGTIEIITKPKRLIQRLFDNLKAISTK